MSLLYKNRIEIPDSLSYNIRAICLGLVGEYDQGSHTFRCPRFIPSQGNYEEIQKFLILHGIDIIEVKGITRLVLGETQADAESKSLDSVAVLGPDALKELTHVRIIERGVTTDLLYLGQKKFFVVDTTRSTILLNDVLEARNQLNKGGKWEFTIYRNGQKFIDEAFLKVGREAWFTTDTVLDIEIFDIPEICTIIDNSDDKSGVLQPKSVTETTLIELINLIRTSIEQAGPSYFEDNQLFPKYDELLSFSKSNGINTYVLNLIAQCVEKGEEHTYQFVRGDWFEFKTKKEEDEDHKKEIERKREDRQTREKEFKDKLKSIKVKKTLLGLFEQDGSIADETEMEKLINSLEEDVDDLDLKGIVTIRTPKTDYADALRKSKRNQKKNIINGTIIGAIVFATIFIAITWVLTKKGAEHFDEKVASIPEMIQEAQYEEASTVLEDAYSNFSPSYMKVRVMLPHKRIRQEIEAAIDKDVQDGIEQIKTILKATRGRFDKNTEEILFRLLQLRPENEELLELKEKWKKS